MEDDSSDAELLVAMLSTAGYVCDWHRVDRREDFLSHIEQHSFDLVLADYSLPDFDGLTALRLLREHDLDVPFVFVSGVLGEERAIEGLRSGATDYVLKTNLSRLVPVVDRALKEHGDQQRRREAEVALQTEAEINAALARVGQELIAALNAPDLLQRLCQLATETLRCDVCYVTLRKPEANAYELVAAYGDVPSPLAALRNVTLPGDLLAPYAEQLAQEQLLAVVANGEPQRLPWHPFAPSGAATATLCAGLFQSETLLGTLLAGYRQRTAAFTAVEERLARGIAQLGSLAFVDAQALGDLRKANRLKSEFLAVMSHELRTPLHQIIGFTDLVLEDEEGLSEEHAHDLRLVARSSRDLLQLINGLLDIGRLEAGQLPVELQETDIAELLGELATEIRPAADTAAVAIVWAVPSGLPLLATDRIKLKLVLHHLIDNALKFTPHGTVTIAAAERNRGVEFTVTDTGIGIPREFLPVIFKAFRQVDSSETRRYGGVGLGLYMAQRLVELLGGTIGVDSEAGRGSTFRVWVPQTRGRDQPAPATGAGDAVALYAELLDATTDLIFSTAGDGRILYANRAWRSTLGYDADDITRLTIADVLHPASAARYTATYTPGAVEPPTLELTFRRKDGRNIDTEGQLRWQVVNGASVSSRGIFRDVTRTKAAEAALRQSEQHYRALVEQAHDAIYTHDLLGNYTSVNPAMERLSGYTREELLTMNAAQLVVPEDFRLTADGTPGDYLMRVRRKDGAAISVDVRSQPVVYDGTVVGWEGMARDVTERQRMESALRQAQASLRLATESAKVALWTSDLRKLTIRFSSGWQRVLGRDETEIPLATLWELVHPEDRARTVAAMQEHIQGRTAAYENEQRMLHADGSYRWVLTRGSATYDAEGRRAYFSGADIDITERKALEEALRRSEEQYRHLVEDISDIIYAADRNGRVTYMSPVLQHLYGYAPTEVVDRPFSDFIFPDDLPGVIEAFNQAIAGNPQPHDHRVVTKSGDVRWMRNHTRLILEGDQVVGLRGVLSDVTDQRRAEDALRVLTVSLEEQVAERTREVAAAHERLRLITDNMFDMVSLVSLHGVHEYVSPAHQRTLGYSADAMLGKSIMDFLHPDDTARVMTAFADGLKTGTGTVEFRYRHADGHYVWLETVGKLLLDEHGAPAGAVLSGRDISERKRAEEALRESEERFAGAFEHAAIGMALVAPDGRWLKVNRALCALVGYSKEELAVMTFQDITHPDDLDTDLEYVRQMLAGTISTYQMEKRYFHKSGRVVWVLLSVSLVLDDQDHPLYFVAQIQDITTRKQAVQAVQTLNAELEQRVLARTAELEAANRELEAFSYSVSHDLRAPLRAIDGFGRMLLEDHADQLGAQGAHRLERVRAATQRMGRLIDGLLQLSRMQRCELRRGQVDLSGLARTIAAELQQAASGRAVTFVIADDVVAEGDPTLLRAALENLLRNAWKYTSKHATARIEFGVTQHDGEPTYFVRDDGAGFDMRFVDKLFGPFHRLHGVSEFEGTGIGLAVVQRIIHRHRGRIWAEAAVEGGATFYFTLPPHAAPADPEEFPSHRQEGLGDPSR